MCGFLIAGRVADSDFPSEITVVFRELVDARIEGRLAELLLERATCEELSAEH